MVVCCWVVCWGSLLQTTLMGARRQQRLSDADARNIGPWFFFRDRTLHSTMATTAQRREQRLRHLGELLQQRDISCDPDELDWLVDKGWHDAKRLGAATKADFVGLSNGLAALLVKEFVTGTPCLHSASASAP